LVNSGNTAGDQMCSSVTINNNGVMVVWTSQNDADSWDLFAKWCDVNGNPLAKSNDADGNPITTFQVNSTSSFHSHSGPGGLGPWGLRLVVWQNDTGGQQNVLGRYGSFCNNDNFDTQEFTVASSTEGNDYNPSLGVCNDTRQFVVSWTSDGQDGSGTGIFAQRFDWCAGPIGEQFQVNTASAGNQDHSSVTMNNSTGDFLVAWSSYNQDSQDSPDVYSQLYSADGTAYGPATRVNTTTEGSQTNSSAAFLSSNNYVVVWNGNGVGMSRQSIRR